jgi:uncharacterized RDD family membrane protein YckC
MVIEDLNQVQNPKSSQVNTYYPADPVERMFSFLLDISFLSPIISLACAYHFQEIIQDEAQNFQSNLWMSMLLTGAFTSISLQSLFLYFFESTPGQAFLSLKVKSVESDRLSWGACFLRSIGFHISCVFFFVPFIESFTHRMGRCLHDRLSDTMVVQFEPPQFRYFSSVGIQNIKKITFLSSFFVVLILLNAFSLDPFLPSISLGSQQTPVDQLVSQALLLKEFDAKKQSEMSERLWTAKNGQERNLIYFYQFSFEKDKIQKEWISQKICQKEQSLICQLTQLSLDQDKKILPSDWKLEKMNLTEKVGLMKQAARVQNFNLAFQVHESLLKNQKIHRAVQIWDVALFIQAVDAKSRSRNPASQNSKASSEIDDYKAVRGEL